MKIHSYGWVHTDTHKHNHTEPHRHTDPQSHTQIQKHIQTHTHTLALCLVQYVVLGVPKIPFMGTVVHTCNSSTQKAETGG
jgi:hypothetical protein